MLRAEVVNGDAFTPAEDVEGKVVLFLDSQYMGDRRGQIDPVKVQTDRRAQLRQYSSLFFTLTMTFLLATADEKDVGPSSQWPVPGDIQPQC